LALESDPAAAGLEPCAVAPRQSNCVLHPPRILFEFRKNEIGGGKGITLPLVHPI
jgi:hypothetical protein